MGSAYFESILLIEKLHRQFLEVVKVVLDVGGVTDINNVQALILYNLGEDDLTVGELTYRGYYLGSNVSYNVKKMAENGYLVQERSSFDKRTVRVRLSAKGLALRDRLRGMFDSHEARLGRGGLDDAGLAGANATLKSLERFWRDMMNETLAAREPELRVAGARS
ncbi:MAG: winged helix DNA-binding protein [Alphaproteobacteria bacterium]